MSMELGRTNMPLTRSLDRSTVEPKRVLVRVCFDGRTLRAAKVAACGC